MRSKLIVVLAMSFAFALTGCEGPAGAPGAKGDPGQDGIDGTDGTNGTDGTDGANGTDGNDGQNSPEYVAPEAAGVVGRVTDTAGVPVGAGTVYFVPAADVAAMGATTVAVGSTTDEPLEDLIDANAATYQSAAIDENGVYRLPDLADGSYFMTFVPGTSDYLPGGSLCRIALFATDIVGSRQDIKVSYAIPEGATYVGSGKCISCHGRTHITGTMHRLGIWSPYEAGWLQDPAKRATDLMLALDTKFTESGVTVYFYGYDSTRRFDKYRTSEVDPGADVSFTVTTRRNASGVYEMLLQNVKDPNADDVVITVDAIYGGGVYKQRYMTRVSNEHGSWLAIMPLQFNQTGEDASHFPRTSKIWRDYHGDWWYDEANAAFKSAIPKNSFEKNCASCHVAGSQLGGSDATVWSITTQEDPVWGDFDYDGNGRLDEMNVGCETCHGPGSDHWASAGQGKHIVNLSLLVPEREAMVCGQCHSRPKGAMGTDNPVNAEGWMMIAGTRRDEFLSDYATTQLDGAPGDFFGDEDKHSKSHHQQYSDFIRSKKYKNGTELQTCSACHDPHGRPFENQLLADPKDNVALCGSCHADETSDVVGHMNSRLGIGVGNVKPNTACTDCHMPKAAKSGAGEPGMDFGTTQYWMGDISSHMFDMPLKTDAKAYGMPTAYVNACGTCHTDP